MALGRRHALISETTIHGGRALALGAVVTVVGLVILIAVLIGGPPQTPLPRPIVYEIVALFPLAGLWLVIHGLKGMARERRLAPERASRPDAPWLWDHTWDPQGTADLGGKRAARAIAFALFSAILLVPANWVAFVERRPEPLWPLIVGFFDLAVVAALVYSAVILLRRAKYRDAQLRFPTFPFFLGRELAVDLLGAPIDCDHLTATLRCIQEEYDRSGDTTAVVGRERYADTQKIDRRRNAGAARLRFALPQGGLATAIRERPARYWELEVTAKTPGLDFHVQFLVPVYRAPGG